MGTESDGITAPLVLVHGDFGDGLDAWNSAATLIGRRCRTVIVDRPGFSTAIAPRQHFSIASDADYILQVTRELGLESFHLAGHSFGGLVAIAMAVARPSALRSLHLIEPPLLDLLRDDPGAQEMDHAARAIQARYADSGDEVTTEAFLATIGAGQAVDRLRGTAEWARLCGHAARFARSEAAGDFPAAALERLPPSLPLGLYTGGRSHPVLGAVVAAIGEKFPAARTVHIANAGHAVQMSGAEFVDPLLAMMRQADAGWVASASAIPGHTARE